MSIPSDSDTLHFSHCVLIPIKFSNANCFMLLTFNLLGPKRLLIVCPISNPESFSSNMGTAAAAVPAVVATAPAASGFAAAATIIGKKKWKPSCLKIF